MNTIDEKIQDSIKFVASNYQRGSFSSAKAWRKVTCTNPFNWVRKIAVAAAVCVFLAASAFLYTTLKPSDNKTEKNTNIKIDNVMPSSQTTSTTARLEFINAPLEDVVKKIEETYGVKITGIPDQNIKLTLSYEGTADDIVETINETLQISLVIEKPSKSSMD